MGVPNHKWMATKLNKDYSLCDTYPRYIVVPVRATDEIIKGSSGFRSRGRLPALSYLHNNGNKFILLRNMYKKTEVSTNYIYIHIWFTI